ncbi:hypothetical protein HPG69_008563, partial [Diceros bicornis minor]
PAAAHPCDRRPVNQAFGSHSASSGFERPTSSEGVAGGGGAAPTNRSPPAPPTGSPSSAGRNRCVDAAEACTADARCQWLRTEFVARCLDRAGPGGCPRARCRRALRRFFARGPPALTQALLFCPCAGPACAERRRQTFVPACAFSGPGPAPPSCLVPLDACEHSRVCRCGRCGVVGRAGRDGRRGGGRSGAYRPPAHRPPARPLRRPRLLTFQASCSPAPSAPDGCLPDQAPRCLRAYAGLVGTRGRDPGAAAAAAAGSLGGAFAWVGRLLRPLGTAVTPNYVDNASARVAPWCDCGASGNRREECEAFRGLFTRNRCLDGAIQAFDSWWPPILQDQLDSLQDPGHSLLQVGGPPWRHEWPGMGVEAESRARLLPQVHALLPLPKVSSADRPLEGSSLLSMLPVLALQPLLLSWHPPSSAPPIMINLRHLRPMINVGRCFLSRICCLVGTTRSENPVPYIALATWLSSPWFHAALGMASTAQ